MHLKRYFIELSYKGTNYFGWQIQPNAITIQEKINQALTRINHNQPLNIVGCGRTDTGVHASKYFAHVDMEIKLELDVLLFKLNGMLPSDIVLHKIWEVPNDLHARFSAKSRTYHYYIHQQKDAFINDTSALFAHELDLDIMNEAGEFLKTRQNFKSFSKVPSEKSNYLCELTFAKWTRINDHQIQFTITANRFLRNMVRAIVGTMLDLGQHKITLDQFKEIVAEQDRNKAGKSALAGGLFLADIEYDED